MIRGTTRNPADDGMASATKWAAAVGALGVVVAATISAIVTAAVTASDAPQPTVTVTSASTPSPPPGRVMRKITSPKTNELAPRCLTVAGEVQNLPSDKALVIA
jgi:ABC-type glycerol-3-phosphate transport system substrate-binding protein